MYFMLISNIKDYIRTSPFLLENWVIAIILHYKAESLSFGIVANIKEKKSR